MVYLFISHSRYDEQIKNFFSNAIAGTDGLNGTFMEFERLEGLYAGIEITEKIGKDNTKGVIVYLERISIILQVPLYTPIIG